MKPPKESKYTISRIVTALDLPTAFKISPMTNLNPSNNSATAHAGKHFSTKVSISLSEVSTDAIWSLRKTYMTMIGRVAIITEYKATRMQRWQNCSEAFPTPRDNLVPHPCASAPNRDIGIITVCMMMFSEASEVSGCSMCEATTHK